MYQGEQAAAAGLLEISRLHHVKPESKLIQELAKFGMPEEACTLALQLADKK